jgi:integrase
MSARIPTYRYHKPSGQAVVTLGGKDSYLGKHGSPESHKLYERLLAEYLANRIRQTPAGVTPNDLTVNELLVAYWDHACSYYVKNGELTSEPATIRQALRPVRDLYGDCPAREFGPMALKAVRRAMIDRGWCRGYINKQIDRIKRMFAWATENELIPVEIYQALKTVPGLRRNRSEAREKPPIGPVPDELVEQTLPHLSPTVATMVRVQRLTGMRPQDVILMRGEDIDRSDTECWVYRPERHKTEHHGRDRLVYLGPRCQEMLRPYLEFDLCGYMFSPKRAEAQRRAELRAGRKTPLTPSQKSRRRKPNPKRTPGDRYDRGAYRKAIRRVCIRLGIPIWFPHQLRHSAATSIRQQYGLEASQAVLGHSELATAQIYAEVDRTVARRIMAEIG